MNIESKKFALIYFLFFLVYIPLGQNLFISHIGRQSQNNHQDISVSRNSSGLKTINRQMLAPFKKSFSRLDVATQTVDAGVNHNSVNISTSLKFVSRSDSDTIVQFIDTDIRLKSVVTEPMTDSNKSAHLTLLDSVAGTVISLSYLDSMTVGVNYLDSVVHYDICFQEATSAKSNSGPYSQSVSNLKDY